MFGGKALGWMAGPLIRMPRARRANVPSQSLRWCRLPVRPLTPQRSPRSESGHPKYNAPVQAAKGIAS